MNGYTFTVHCLVSRLGTGGSGLNCPLWGAPTRGTKMRYASFVAALALIGCATDPVIVLHNPQTGATVRCRTTDDYIIPQDGAEACAKTYEKAGFRRVGQY